MMLGCAEAVKKFSLDTICCVSCHDDANDIGYEMCWLEEGSQEYEVCCVVKNAVATRMEAKDGR